MQKEQEDMSISVCNGALTIEDRPGNPNPWSLVDEQSGAEISVCPEEVPAMIALFRGFRRSVANDDHPRALQPNHDCTEHTVEHDVGGLTNPITECTICGQMVSHESA